MPDATSGVARDCDGPRAAWAGCARVQMWDAPARLRGGASHAGRLICHRAKGRQMAERAAIVTGASSGIGLAIARMLGEEGFGITMAARRAEKLEAAAAELAEEQFDVQSVAANVADEAEIQKVTAAHKERYGRLDVLVNNAGVGIGAQLGEIQTKRMDMQLDINLRSIIIFYRECLPMLQAAGAEHKNALVVNTASIAGKRGEGWLSVYAAAKHGVVGWTESMNRELAALGIKSTALCPAFVDTPMTDFAKEHVPAEEMIRPWDIAESVRYLLKVSPACVVPEIMFIRPGDAL
jgi:NAD(P)-dependent dehydrogenase (short-subunit alcohol dehydrogenase family)